MKTTQFSFKRVEKQGVSFQNKKARIQVDGNCRQFNFKKTATTNLVIPTLDFSDPENSQYIALIHPF